MDIQEITLHVILRVSYKDSNGYTSYVFENIDYHNYDYQYITCTRFPNWMHSELVEGEEGFVQLKIVKEGIDKWFDGKEFHPYMNDILIFLKFIRMKPVKVTSDIVVD